MLKTSTLWQPIHIINSVDETKLSCNTPLLPPTPTTPTPTPPPLPPPLPPHPPDAAPQFL